MSYLLDAPCTPNLGPSSLWRSIGALPSLRCTTCKVAGRFTFFIALPRSSSPFKRIIAAPVTNEMALPLDNKPQLHLGPIQVAISASRIRSMCTISSILVVRTLGFADKNTYENQRPRCTPQFSNIS
jgi:hypothetical protein